MDEGECEGQSDTKVSFRKKKMEKLFFFPEEETYNCRSLRKRADIIRGPPALCRGSLLIYNPALSLAKSMKCSCGVTKSPQFCKRRSRGAIRAADKIVWTYSCRGMCVYVSIL
jgi:hypothetical protein